MRWRSDIRTPPISLESMYLAPPRPATTRHDPPRPPPQPRRSKPTSTFQSAHNCIQLDYLSREHEDARYMHTIHAHDTCTRYMHTVHAHDTCTRYMRARYMHTVHARTEPFTCFKGSFTWDRSLAPWPSQLVRRDTDAPRTMPSQPQQQRTRRRLGPRLQIPPRPRRPAEGWTLVYISCRRPTAPPPRRPSLQSMLRRHSPVKLSVRSGQQPQTANMPEKEAKEEGRNRKSK